MTVSVIVPALNEEQSLPATIRSAREARADEVIVVDGGSADRTVETARPLADLVIGSPAGRATQMNAGAWRKRFVRRDCSTRRAASARSIARACACNCTCAAVSSACAASTSAAAWRRTAASPRWALTRAMSSRAENGFTR